MLAQAIQPYTNLIAYITAYLIGILFTNEVADGLSLVAILTVASGVTPLYCSDV